MKEIKIINSANQQHDLFFAFKENGIVIIDVGSSDNSRAKYSKLFYSTRNTFDDAKNITKSCNNGWSKENHTIMFMKYSLSPINRSNGHLMWIGLNLPER